MLNLIGDIFETGKIPQQMTWETMVIIPKGNKKFRGIGILDTVWKLCSNIINRRRIEEIKYHDSLHGFRGKRGTGTAILEEKHLISEAKKKGK